MHHNYIGRVLLEHNVVIIRHHTCASPMQNEAPPEQRLRKLQESGLNALVRDNLADGGSANEQLELMQDKCAQAAELLGLHKRVRQVQLREYIAGNKRVMASDLTVRKQQRLLQTEQPKATECTAQHQYQNKDCNGKQELYGIIRIHACPSAL